MTAAQTTAVSMAALNACDLVGGQHLGFLLDPSQCRYDPTLDAGALCVASGGSNAETVKSGATLTMLDTTSISGGKLNNAGTLTLKASTLRR